MVVIKDHRDFYLFYNLFRRMEALVNKSELATRLLRLHYEMREIAVCMNYYGGFSDWARLAPELLMASEIARNWYEEVINDA